MTATAHRGAVDRWLAVQLPQSRAALARAVSATDLRIERAEFGQKVSPVPGSVLASTVRSRWDPEPDYGYHWPRDAAVVMAVAPLLRRTDPHWDRHFADYIAFSVGIATRPGRAANPLRACTIESHSRFLRPDAELLALSDDALLGEPRFSADGGPDLERWGRPQFDGPALRALSCMAWDGPIPNEMDRLLGLDLGFTARHAAEPCLGPWEEEPADLNVFTLMAQRACLLAVPAGSDAALAKTEAALETLWTGRFLARAAAAREAPDASTILGALLVPNDAAFGVADQRVLATVAEIEGWASRNYPINAGVPVPLIGRWQGDVFFGGNPWLPTSFGLAEFYARLADALLDRDRPSPISAEDQAADPAERAARLLTKADAIFERIAKYVSGDGSLPEQIHRQTGKPVSCPDLSWSHAALISAAAKRDRALRRLSG